MAANPQLTGDKSKFKKLDRKFAAAVVGDGSGAVVGHSRPPKDTSFDNRSYLSCAGGFGEIGEVRGDPELEKTSIR